jgi:hypothetical protein|tara:strand:+ start:46 stop:270 length:225 start_codon:yes stop_codon:yes gene_type:complete
MARKLSLTTKRIYRKRVKKSPCRGKNKVSCRSTSGCKVSKGRKRTFCRKKLNTKKTNKVAFRITRRARHNRRRR